MNNTTSLSSTVQTADKAQRLYNKYFKSFQGEKIAFSMKMIDTYAYEVNYNKKQAKQTKKITFGAKLLAQKIMLLLKNDLLKQAKSEPQRFVDFMQDDVQHIEIKTNRFQLADMLNYAPLLNVSKETAKKQNASLIRSINNYLHILADKTHIDQPFLLNKINTDIKGKADENGRGGFILQVNKYYVIHGFEAEIIVPNQLQDVSEAPSENTQQNVLQSADNEAVAPLLNSLNGKNLQQSITIENNINSVNILFSNCIEDKIDSKSKNNLLKTANAEKNKYSSNNDRVKISARPELPPIPAENAIVADIIANADPKNKLDFMQKNVFLQAYSLFEGNHADGKSVLSFVKFIHFVAKCMKKDDKKPSFMEVWKELVSFLTYLKRIFDGKKPYRYFDHFFSMETAENGDFVINTACARSIYTGIYQKHKEKTAAYAFQKSKNFMYNDAVENAQIVAIDTITAYTEKLSKFGFDIALMFLKNELKNIPQEIHSTLLGRIEHDKIEKVIEIFNFNMKQLTGSQLLKQYFK